MGEMYRNECTGKMEQWPIATNPIPNIIFRAPFENKQMTSPLFLFISPQLVYSAQIKEVQIPGFIFLSKGIKTNVAL